MSLWEKLWPFSRKSAPRRTYAMPQPERQGFYSRIGYRTRAVQSRDGHVSSAASGAVHDRFDRPALIAMSREFQRDGEVYAGPIERMVDIEVGTGFALQMRTSDADYNRDVERQWAEWCKAAEVSGLTFAECERMMDRERIIAGDATCLMLGSGQLQLVEAEQVASSDYKLDGIERDKAGKPLRYFVAPYGDSGAPQVGAAVAVDARYVCFLADKVRPSSVRCVPKFQQTFTTLHRIKDLCDSAAKAAVLQACYAVAFELEQGGAAAFRRSQAEESPEDGDLAQRMQQVEAGLIFYGKPGEKVKGIERTAPGGTFWQDLLAFMRLVASASGYPLEVLFMDWTQSNYSQCRASIEQATQTSRRPQQKLEDTFHRPVFQWWLRRRFADRAIMRPQNLPVEELFAHEWIKPAFPWVDPEKETNAHGLQIDRGFTTYAKVAKERGQDVDDLRAALVAEAKAAWDAHKEVLDYTDGKWAPPAEHFAGMAAPKPASPAPADEPKPEPAKQGARDA